MIPGRVMVDSNVLLDILTEDKTWFAWSAEKLAECAESSTLCINAVIYAELSIGFARIEDLEAALPGDAFDRIHLPYEAAFLAGKCFLRYRRDVGLKRSPLPDFLIGAHAAVGGMTLLTRDSSRYRTYFPGLALICP
ncbi:MAG: type II toxin-antitoxin system VapC family toxin [Nitrospirae bacterium]|nr:type II toxin-antitoxin system VapC family toxin [Nitrospirota bacterium]